jgi:uncharacterized protein YciI
MRSNEYFAVIRGPSLPEDEGRSHMIASFRTLAEARAWIEKQEGQFFSPGCYSIMRGELQ